LQTAPPRTGRRSPRCSLRTAFRRVRVAIPEARTNAPPPLPSIWGLRTARRLGWAGVLEVTRQRGRGNGGTATTRTWRPRRWPRRTAVAALRPAPRPTTPRARTRWGGGGGAILPHSARLSGVHSHYLGSGKGHESRVSWFTELLILRQVGRRSPAVSAHEAAPARLAALMLRREP